MPHLRFGNWSESGTRPISGRVLDLVRRFRAARQVLRSITCLGSRPVGQLQPPFSGRSRPCSPTYRRLLDQLIGKLVPACCWN